jgi:8-oxo-dGTP pyrophosphatase MutT (NUDIX family)
MKKHIKKSMTENKILGETEFFQFVERDSMAGLVPKFMNVVIMPFLSDPQGLPMSVGVIVEKNPFREGNSAVCLITGSTDETDPDLLSTAKRELKEESGFDVSDNERWYYLGSVTSSKFVDHEQPCFAVDVTEITRGNPEPDGSEKEAQMDFKFISANEVVKAKDIFIPGLFLKLFKYVLGFDIQDKSTKLDLEKKEGKPLVLWAC